MQRIVLTAAAYCSPEHDAKLLFNGWEDTIKIKQKIQRPAVELSAFCINDVPVEVTLVKHHLGKT